MLTYAAYALRYVCVGYVCSTPSASVPFHLSHRLLMTYRGSLFGTEALMAHRIKKYIYNRKEGRAATATLYASFHRLLLTRLFNRLLLTYSDMGLFWHAGADDVRDSKRLQR